ncbi:response regulator transcription factor [Streptomyces sp. AD55]|uniref:response regulator transcription factor n=1 Tax=Streptomyces sp. AD55 TaxID=3242895 RepID=UPI0035299A71
MTLSTRQLAVLRLRAEGHTGPQIAAALHLAVSTVAYHERVICHRLAATNLTHAVHLAYQVGILRRERHGDHAGFAAHQRRGEPPCDLCVAGEREYRAGRRRKTAA